MSRFAGGEAPPEEQQECAECDSERNALAGGPDFDPWPRQDQEGVCAK